MRRSRWPSGSAHLIALNIIWLTLLLLDDSLGLETSEQKIEDFQGPNCSQSNEQLIECASSQINFGPDPTQLGPSYFGPTNLGNLFNGPQLSVQPAYNYQQQESQDEQQLPKFFFTNNQQQVAQSQGQADGEQPQPVLVHSAEFNPFANVVQSLPVANNDHAQQQQQQAPSGVYQINSKFLHPKQVDKSSQMASANRWPSSIGQSADSLLPGAYRLQQAARFEPSSVPLNRLLQPGEALLAESEASERSGSRGGTARSKVSVREIESLLARLKPLEIDTKQAGVAFGGKKRLASLGGELTQLRKGQAEGREKEEEDPEAEDEREDEQEAAAAARLPNAAEQQDELAKALMELGTQLASGPHKSPPGIERHRSATRRQVEATNIPIELLVDQLMSGGRAASRRRVADPQGAEAAREWSTVGQVDQDYLAEPVAEGNELVDYTRQGPREANELDSSDDDDDEEEQEEQEADTAAEPYSGEEDEEEEGDGLVELEPQESRTESRPKFEQVANKSDSWVPLAVVSGISRPVPASEPLARTQSETEKQNTKKMRRKRGPSEEADKPQVILGNRKLSRAQLLQLIKALNRVASSKEASKQRDAARKLLRLLIRVALIKFKESQLRSESKKKKKKKKNEGESQHKEEDAASEQDVARLKNSLRSLLLEPQVSTGGPGENGTQVSIEMQPWLAAKKMFVEQAAQDEQEEEQQHQKQQQQQGPSDKAKKSLAEVSDDLEQYFDTDFFEDLADKKPSNSTGKRTEKLSQGNNRNQEGSEQPVSGSRARLALGSQRMEQADEEDVELDHVRVPRARAKAKRQQPRSSSRQAEGEENGDEDGRKSRIARTKLSEDQRESAREKRKRIKRKKKNRRRRKRKRLEQGRTAAESNGRRSTKSKSDDEYDRDHDDEPEDREGSNKRASKESPEKLDGRAQTEAADPRDPDESEEEEKEEEERRKDELGSSRGVGDDNLADKKQRDAGPLKGRRRTKKSRKRRRKRRGEQRDRKRERPPEGYRGNEEDFEEGTRMERNEIPAPILAERSPPQKTTKTDSKQQKVKGRQGTSWISKPATKREKSGKVSVNLKQDKRKGIGQKPSKKLPVKEAKNESKTKSGLKSGKSRRASGGILEREKPEKGSQSDELHKPADNNDYDYGEGTTYTEFCNDDGKCEVTMKSSNPKLSKAIEDKDEPTLVRQLDKFIKEDADRRSDVSRNGTIIGSPNRQL